MVFGWGKKKKSIEAIPQNKAVPLSEVQKIVTDLTQLRKSQTLAEIKDLRNNTQPLIDELIKIGNVLEKDNLDVDDIDKHLAVIVVRGKQQVIDVIKKDAIHLPKISSIDDAENLNSSLSQTLKKIGDVLGRQTRVIHIFAKKYAVQLKENLETMNVNHSKIRKILKSHDLTQSVSDEITSTLNQITTLKNTRVEKTQKIADINQSITSIDEKISLTQKSIEEIKSSENYKKFINLKNTLDTFASKKFQIKNYINAQFTKISRPLSRYEYASSLDKDQKNILTNLVADPFNVLLPQNTDSIIVILENIRKGILSGSISVKGVEKTLSNITETEEALDGFVKQVAEYLEKQEKMKNDLVSLKSNDLASLESKLLKNISFRDDFQLKSKSAQDEIDGIDSKIPQLVSEIETKLRRFSNTKYTIVSSKN